jgi:hypothetical protein
MTQEVTTADGGGTECTHMGMQLPPDMVFIVQCTFGYGSTKIGNKSIRSGAAMSLFLRNVSATQIILLGHWLSKVFLAYIQPQVLEWTSNMSRSMIKIDSFLDPSSHDVADHNDP